MLVHAPQDVDLIQYLFGRLKEHRHFCNPIPFKEYVLYEIKLIMVLANEALYAILQQ